ncbi:T9SS type A sorting domain-containing protein [Brumimicrobium glaciale]|uniref:T9SS type A sorting domain-containing protein n=1 Tax=Brumimicrobium glaciale TaxID=200475 RepID=A0A4Q4KMQ9_9FLAO|nr:T9SS type A sorting domain-containing protein [Brumimicrobium glaciale]RYM34047.1 T9SS type A sorting domain-containing protein [Brumimicrobium glaciale]
MKITILATTLLLSAAQLFGQSVQIVSVNDLTTDLSGTTVEVVDDKNEITIYSDFKVINSGAQPIKVKYKRVRDFNSNRVDEICDNSQCYAADDAYTYISPTLNQINPGDSSIFKPQIRPDGMESCAVHKYYVVGEFGTVYDSINVIFKTTNADCNLSVDKNMKETPLSIFPNPAQDFLTIKGDGLKDGGTVIFLDALGKEVKRASVKGINTKLSVSDLKRGVYFVNINGNNGTKSNVQRLIIQ